MKLPSPATGTELFLAAILDELRALRAAVEGGGPGAVARQIDEALDEVADAVSAPKPSTKRTRARTPR